MKDVNLMNKLLFKTMTAGFSCFTKKEKMFYNQNLREVQSYYKEMNNIWEDEKPIKSKIDE